MLVWEQLLMRVQHLYVCMCVLMCVCISSVLCCLGPAQPSPSNAQVQSPGCESYSVPFLFPSPPCCCPFKPSLLQLAKSSLPALRMDGLQPTAVACCIPTSAPRL